MSKFVQILLFIISTIVQIDELDSVPFEDYSNSLVMDCSGSPSVFLYGRIKCQDNHIWKRLDSLRQWKRRRRSNLTQMLKEKTDRINNVKKPINKLDPYQTSTNMNQNKSLIENFKDKWPVHIWRENGFYSDDYLKLINPHWLQFPPPHPATHYIFGSIYILMMVTGIIGNVLVLSMYFRCRTLRTPGNILVANLALSDFIMLAKTPVFIYNSFNLGPALGKTGCLIYGFVGGLTGTTSIATLSAIAMDRYWAVVRPLEPLRALTAIRARLMAIGAWVYAAIFAVIPALDIGYGRYVSEGYLTSCSFDYLTDETAPRYFIFVFFCAAWLVPFCTISFCYISIFRVVVCNRNITTNNQEQRLSSRHVKERTKRKAEIKLAFLVMAVIALFFVSWTPYAVVSLIGIFGRKDLITPLSSMVPALFCKTAACINPFIYIITHPMFRKEFKKMLFREKSKRRSGTWKTVGTSSDTFKLQRPSKDLSDTDVEIVEMKDIPFRSRDMKQKTEERIKTLSSRVCDRQDSQRSMSTKSFEENVVTPPSWFCKPQFAKKKSFHRRSTKSIVSTNTDPTI
uniref:Opsin UV-like protein n=1 Tax=Dendrolimus punctatus TaxID=238572 RepID=A0A6C0X6S0_9NEOP|nr:opsin UV-like protein [Dendrolimus punctatus]